MPTGEVNGLYRERGNDKYWYYVNYYGQNFISYSWGGAYNLFDHELQRGGKVLKYWNDAQAGDLIFANFRGTGSGNIDHTGIVTGRNPDGTPQIVQHPWLASRTDGKPRHENTEFQDWLNYGPSRYHAKTQIWVVAPVNG